MNYKIKGQWLHLEIPHTTTLKDFLDELHISPKKRQDYVYKIGFQTVQPQAVLHAQEILSINAFKPGKIDYVPEALFELEVIYEDPFVLVVDKPAGYIIHDQSQSLNNVVAAYYKAHKIHQPIRHLSRLDKETSGLIMYCKCPFIQPYLDAMLQTKAISRIYLATTTKKIKFDQYDCTAPIGKNRHKNNVYGVYPQGKKARTLFTKVDDYHVRCQLFTGRTHQIRVHLAHLGYPIKNDAIYGTITDNTPMGLVAYELIYPHPITHELLCIRKKEL